MSIDHRIVATTVAEAEVLDLIARSPDLSITLREGGGVLITGRGLWVKRDRLADVEPRDLVPRMPEGWDK